ncbi:hypothetical protein HY637_05820 [Candidatus Woesearchaeota archaeon]|nr:hypothetical protein [Candidatus Woesearchaeota archaeon]
MSHLVAEEHTTNAESAILGEIREAEKKADEIIEKGRLEKDRIIQEARSGASKLLLSKEEELKKSQEKKIMDFRDKARLLSEEKLAEGKLSAKQAKSKSEKNMQKAVDFVLKKFEEMI